MNRTKAQTSAGRSCLLVREGVSGWGEAEKREIMALFLESLSVRCPREVHVDTGLKGTLGL